MSVSNAPANTNQAIGDLWSQNLASHNRLKRLEQIVNIQGNLASIFENITKQLQAIPGSATSSTTISDSIDPSTINHDALSGISGGGTLHTTTEEKNQWNTA